MRETALEMGRHRSFGCCAEAAPRWLGACCLILLVLGAGILCPRAAQAADPSLPLPLTSPVFQPVFLDPMEQTLMQPAPSPLAARGSVVDSFFRMDEQGAATFFCLRPNASVTPYLDAQVDVEATVPGIAQPTPEAADAGTYRGAYRLATGVRCALGQGTRLDLDYRYSAADFPKIVHSLGLLSAAEAEEHQFLIGFNVLF